jgi:hypothetical protein
VRVPAFIPQVVSAVGDCGRAPGISGHTVARLSTVAYALPVVSDCWMAAVVVVQYQLLPEAASFQGATR